MVATTDPEQFIAELARALAARGWLFDHVPRSGSAPLTGRAAPGVTRWSDQASDLHVDLHSRPGRPIAELHGFGWQADLTAAATVTAALAAIDAADAADTDRAIAEVRGGGSERTLSDLLDAAGWQDTVSQGERGTERTWWTAPAASGLEYLSPVDAWMLTRAPDFTDGATFTGDQNTPPAVLAALALTA
jgi:hypothetical protein